MNKAFVKDADENAGAEFPDRLISPHPNHVTAGGLAMIDEAVARWDAERDAALISNDKDAVVRVHREQRYWAARRISAHLSEPDPSSPDVQFGSTVTFERADGRRQSFQIVGEDEADPATGTISHVSPLARSLMGKSVGELARAGDAEVEIVAIVQR